VSSAISCASPRDCKVPSRLAIALRAAWRRSGDTGRVIVLAVIIITVITGGGALLGVMTLRTIKAEQEANDKRLAEKKAQVLREKRTEWDAQRADIMQRIRAQLKKGDFDTARMTIGRYTDVAPEEMAPFGGELQRGLDAERAHADAEAKLEEKRAKQRELAWRKSHGVEIGMTQREVLLSNWGRPQRVNRTDIPGHQHEQWVYGIGNYLYFKDGVLASIQTTR
jgi:hypothetical protein